MITSRGAWRSDRRTVGPTGNALTQGQEDRSVADMDPAAVGQRDTVGNRAGTRWRDVPERYGPWDRVYDLFRRWQRNGTWKSSSPNCRPSGRRGPDHVGCERRLHCLPGPPARRRTGRNGDRQKEPPGGIDTEPADHGLGRSRGAPRRSPAVDNAPELIPPLRRPICHRRLGRA